MITLNRSVAAVLLLRLFIPHAALSEEYKPKIAAASKDAELALQSFVIPDGMTGSLLAAEPKIANPVAFHVTNDGRVFVCETFRQQVGVEDNRSHMDWLNNDLRLESVEERLEMFRKYLGDDAAGYGVEHDRIRLLKDTDGNGTLDESTVFADGFNDILDGTGAGILEVDGSVYYTCIPKLWRLEDSDDDGKADKREALHHGYGVRVAFRGHDMHGLVRGPDGRIYFSIGDRGYNVITKEGTRLKRPDSGAVFRCDVDGSNLEVFAYGLRNPQELAFDNYGNLFTVDNNSDSGDKARLTYIVQDSDTGWRMYFQYLPDRGPWNRERMWYPHHADSETTAVQPPHIVPPLANISDGPSGFTFYPGLGLNDRYKDHFFLADFRGGSANSGIRSFAIKPKGASFEPVDSHQFIWSILATDVDFAPDGSLYISDWVNGWDGEGKGRLYRFEDTEHISAVAGANVPQLLNGGVRNAENGELLLLLNHADRRVRQTAQFELAKRDDRKLLMDALLGGHSKLAQRHIAWIFWQIGLRSPADAADIIDIFADLTVKSGDLGHQNLRILADLMKRHGVAAVTDTKSRGRLRETLRELTASKDLRAAGFAAVALGRVGLAEDTAAIETLLARISDSDPVVRHQCVIGLSEIAKRQRNSLLNAAHHETAAVRKAAVLAMARNQNFQLLRQKMHDKDADVVLSAARALVDEQFGIGDAEVADAETRYNGPPALTRRILEAHYRIGAPANAASVAKLAANDDQSDDVRLVACDMLRSWNSPQQTNTVNGRWRPLPLREEILHDAIQPHIVGMLGGSTEIRKAAVEVAALHGIKNIVPTLERILAQSDVDQSLRVAAFRALAALGNDVEGLLARGSKDSAEEIRIAALEIAARRNPMVAIPALADAVKSGSIRAKQTALQLLGENKSEQAAAVLSEAFADLNSKSQPRSVTLDLLDAAEANASESLQQYIAAYRTKQIEAGTKVALWSECLEGGDAARGRTVFFGRAAASCRRCHTVNGEGAAVGPDLSAIAKDKDRTYLLEAIVDPNAKIAKGFETTIIVDFDGRIHSGIVKEDNDKVVKLMTPKGAIVTIPADEIDDRGKGQSGMPSDITRGLTRAEIRDLVEYLSTLKVAKKSASHGKE